MQASLQWMHWTTSSYVAHRAIQSVQSSLYASIDQLVETVLAHEPSKRVPTALHVHPDIDHWIRQWRDMAHRCRVREQQSLLDDVVNSLHQLQYLLRMST